MRRFEAAAAAATLLLAFAAIAGTAGAQSWTKDSTPLVIQPIVAPQGEQIARPGEPLLVQPMTSVRSARLDVEAPTLMGVGTQKYPAGTALYAVQAPDGWIYCAAARTWLMDPTTICYQDTDGDHRFDRVRNSGVPFGEVPLLVHEFGPPRQLPQPIAFTDIGFSEAPSIGYAIRWKPVRDRHAGKSAPIYAIDWGAAIRVGERSHDLGDGPQIALFGIRGETPVIRPMDVLGGRIQVLGVTPEGNLRYRVDRSIPSQVMQISMTLTVSTYYYVY